MIEFHSTKKRMEYEIELRANELYQLVSKPIFLDDKEYPSEINEFIYLGEKCNALNANALNAIGVVNILNMAPNNVQTGKEYYVNAGLKVENYLELNCHDEDDFDISIYFSQISEYLTLCKQNYSQSGGKVLVHCAAGISRSATALICYLVKGENKSLEEAFKLVKERRGVICPNIAFVKSLVRWESELFSKN